MGAYTNAMIDLAREAAGFELPTETQLALLQKMKRTSIELLEVLVLEEAGIRDGDGFYHGSDPIAALADQLKDLSLKRLDDTDVEPVEQLPEFLR